MSSSRFHLLMPISSLPAETSCPQQLYVLVLDQYARQASCSFSRVRSVSKFLAFLTLNVFERQQNLFLFKFKQHFDDSNTIMKDQH